MSKAAAKYSDLTRSEGAPTARADVDLPLQFEKIKIKGGIGAATGQMEVQTHTRSPMSNAGAALMLAVGGGLCSGVFHLIAAPGWAQLGGMFFPWLITLTSGPIRTWHSNRRPHRPEE